MPQNWGFIVGARLSSLMTNSIGWVVFSETKNGLSRSHWKAHFCSWLYMFYDSYFSKPWNSKLSSLVGNLYWDSQKKWTLPFDDRCQTNIPHVIAGNKCEPQIVLFPNVYKLILFFGLSLLHGPGLILIIHASSSLNFLCLLILSRVSNRHEVVGMVNLTPNLGFHFQLVIT